jgi:hypothetical protein
MHPEPLEARELLSLLINAKPTLDIQPGPGVHRSRGGGFVVTQPATVRVSGTAQPPIGFSATVEIFAQDRNGRILNGGRPLATATPDRLGRYSATLTLPSRIRRDTNSLVAFETVTGAINSNLTIDPTTVSGLNSALAINGTTLRDFNGRLTIAAGTTVGGITGVVATTAGTTLTLSDGTITAGGGTISGLSGTLTVPAGTPLTVGATPGTIGTIAGAVAITAGGTVDGLTGTVTGLIGTLGGSTGTFTQSGTGTLGAQTGTLTGATGAIDPTTGTSTQTGTAGIAGTIGTSTTPVTEFAVSDPLTVRVHVPPGLASAAGFGDGSAVPRVGATRVHPAAEVARVFARRHRP